MVSDTYDVVIVGGGPAGSMAARSAAQKGARTLLLERDAHIGLPVRCGEALVVTDAEKLIKVDERCISSRVEGVVMYAPDNTALVVPIMPEWGEAVILERCIFDRYLAESAAEAGADIITRADVDGLLTDNGYTKGVKYTRFGKRSNVRAGVVIGADGIESRIGRWAGLNTNMAPDNVASTYQMTITNVDFDERYCHFYFGYDLARGGYLWLFPKGERTANIGIGVIGGRSEKSSAYSKLTDFIKKRFGRVSVIAESAGGVPGDKPLKNPVGNGLILAGDAGRHCNPLSGGGIYCAMLAGNFAGGVSADAASGGDVSAGALKRFSKLIRKDITRPNNVFYRIAKVTRNLNDKALNDAAKRISSIPVHQRSVVNIAIKVFTAHPKMIMDFCKLLK